MNSDPEQLATTHEEPAPHYFPIVPADYYDPNTGGKTSGLGKKKSGRKPIQITEALCEKAKQLASQGLLDQEIMYCLGMGKSSFYEKMVEFPEFREAMEAGRAMGIASVSNAAFKNAMSGHFPAQRFLLKTMGKRRETGDPNMHGTIHITIDETDAKM